MYIQLPNFQSKFSATPISGACANISSISVYFKTSSGGLTVDIYQNADSMDRDPIDQFPFFLNQKHTYISSSGIISENIFPSLDVVIQEASAIQQASFTSPFNAIGYVLYQHLLEIPPFKGGTLIS